MLGGEEATEKEEKDEEDELTVVRIIRALGVVVNKKGDGKDLSSDAVWKESEDAAHAVGMVAVSNRSATVLEACKAVLFSTAGLKRTEEFHLCVGEALACCAGGRVLTSPQLLSQLRLPAAYQDAGSDAERAAAAWASAGTPDGTSTVMVQVLDHVMNEVLSDGKPLVRAAGAPWLLCLLRYNAESPEVQSRISVFQQHFAYLLQEKGEYIQEVASKGLGLCYDMCSDDAVKDELVATLAKALMSGTAMAQPKSRKTDEDEKLFEEGEVKIDDKALGEGSLTTYKELCTVATELGQPELIYRFLNLAGHQKVWNSRRGAAFGFSLIANKAADRLKPHLASLIPKLYRYQYDPNQSIQEAMGNLWQTVVPDPDKAKDEYLPHIFKELIPGVGSRLWRVRQASCLGLADLLNGKRFPQVEEHLVEVYRMSLRAIDDVKETVRQAGQTLNRAVSGLCAKLADPSQSDAASAEKVLGLVLPLLLQEGLATNSAEVRIASVQQLVKITKHAGATLAPHIPEMASVLLESLSSLEPQMNTYLQLNADKYQVSGEALERARVSASRNSPLAETLDLCVRHMNETAADALMPRLVAVVRQGVGLPTRCGCARFIGQLAVTPGPVGQVVRRHSSKLLKCLGAATASDRSPVVRQAMAGAAARVVAVAKESAVDEYIRDLASTYFNHGPEDVSLRVVVGQACKDMLAMAADAIRDFLPQLLPLVFIAREDEDKDAAEAFQTVWEEGAGSTSAGLRLYSKEISEFIRIHLASPSWVVRKMAAKAAFASVDAGEGLGAADAARASRAVSLLPALRCSVANARMWDGKECVLKALASSVVAANESTLDLSRWRAAAGAAADAASPAADTPMHDATVAVYAMGTTSMLEEDAALSRRALVELVIAECSKKRSSYRKAALLALKTMLEKLPEIDVATLVMDVVSTALAEKKEETPPPGAVPSAGRDADDEARFDALMENKGQQELRARALEALAAAWPAARSTRIQLAAALLLLLEPSFKSPSMEERIAATSVAASVCARMSADLQGGRVEGEGGVGEGVLAEVRREWEGVVGRLMYGLYLGMNDLGLYLFVHLCVSLFVCISFLSVCLSVCTLNPQPHTPYLPLNKSPGASPSDKIS
jgi:proteasome component ECM29